MGEFGTKVDIFIGRCQNEVLTNNANVLKVSLFEIIQR